MKQTSLISRLLTIPLVLAGLLLAPAVSQAANTYYYTSTVGGGTPATDGGGTWSTSSANWLLNSNGTAVNWANNNNAVIGNGGTPGLISCASALVVGNITFNAVASGWYTFNSGYIRLGGAGANGNISDIYLPVGQTADFGNGASSSQYFGEGSAGSGLTCDGGGTLILSFKGHSTYTGATTITNNTTVLVYSNSAFYTSARLNLSSGTLATYNSSPITFANVVNLKGNFTIGAPATRNGIITFGTGAWTLSGGSWTMTVDTISATINSAIGDGGGGLGLGFSSLSGGTLTLGGTETYTGPTTINSGTLALASGGNLNAASGVVIAAGATFDVSAQSTWTAGSTASPAITASGTGTAATIKGGTTVALSSSPITLNWDGTHDTMLTISSGALTLGGNTITINGGSTFSHGPHSIVQVIGGSITLGTSPTVMGTAIAGGDVGTITTSGGIPNYLVLNVGSSTPADAGQSTVSASPTSVSADGISTSTITVTLKDSSDNLLAGKTVTLAQTTGSGATISPSSGISGGNGQVMFTVKSSTLGGAVFTATDTTDPGPVVIAQTATVTFTTPPAGDAGQSTVSASPNGALANGIAISVITVTVKDSGGNPLPGKTVTLAQTGGSGATISGGGTSGLNGQVTFTVQSSTAGPAVFTATDTTDPGPVVITQTATVNFSTTAIFKNFASGDWASGAIWQVSFDGGSTYQAANAAPTNGVNATGIIISGSADSTAPFTGANTVTHSSSDSVTATNMIVHAGGQITVSGGTFTIGSGGGAPDCDVFGTILQTGGTLTLASGPPTGTLTFENGGRFIWTVANAVRVPTATWADGSTCLLTPSSYSGTTLATNITGQSFYDLTITNPAVGFRLQMGVNTSTTVRDTLSLTIPNTASCSIALFHTNSVLGNGGNAMLTVKNFTSTSGTVANTCKLLLADAILTNDLIQISGNLSISGYVDGFGNANTIFEFNNSGAQSLTIPTGANLLTPAAISYLVDTSSALTLNSAISSCGTFTNNGTLNFNANQINGGNLALNATGTVDGNGTGQLTTGLASITYGGTLNINQSLPVFTGGESFVLFGATTYNPSTFSSIVPATPGAGLIWDQSQMGNTGTLNVSLSSGPAISTTTVSGGYVVMSGSGGPANAGFTVLTSTNLALPLASWTVDGTGAFGNTGSFNYTSTAGATNPAAFFIITVP